MRRIQALPLDLVLGLPCLVVAREDYLLRFMRAITGIHLLELFRHGFQRPSEVRVQPRVRHLRLPRACPRVLQLVVPVLFAVEAPIGILVLVPAYLLCGSRGLLCSLLLDRV